MVWQGACGPAFFRREITMPETSHTIYVCLWAVPEGCTSGFEWRISQAACHHEAEERRAIIGTKVHEFTWEWNGEVVGHNDEITSDISDWLDSTPEGSKLWDLVGLNEQE